LVHLAIAAEFRFVFVLFFWGFHVSDALFVCFEIRGQWWYIPSLFWKKHILEYISFSLFTFKKKKR